MFGLPFLILIEVKLGLYPHPRLLKLGAPEKSKLVNKLCSHNAVVRLVSPEKFKDVIRFS